MNRLPHFTMIKTKINQTKDINYLYIKNKFANKKDNINFVEIDGLKILWKDKWVHIRKSNTEPIIRIISEAKDKHTANKLINSIKNIIK